MFNNAKWLWAEKNDGQSGDCVFRYTFDLEKRPKTSLLTVAATGACFVSVNGEYVLYAAGRDRTETETFHMTADITRELKKGVNVVVARVTGGADRNGFALEIDEPAVASGEGFLVYQSTAYTRNETVTTYNATTEHRLEGIHTAEFSSDLFKPATVGEGAEAVLANVRSAPLFDAGRKRGYDKIDGGIVMDTEPGAVYPKFTITANSGDKLVITGSLSAKTLEYIARAETQSFEFDEPLYGQLTFTYPATVKLNEAGYRLVECGAERTGEWKCDSRLAEELYEKAENTFRICAAGAFTSVPDGKTITPLDASVMARAGLYLLSGGATYAEQMLGALLDALDGKPSWVTTDNKLYTLYALSGMGLHGDCAAAVNNADLKQRALAATAAFIETFDVNDPDLKRLADGRFNVDGKLMAESLVYSAAKLCRATAAELGITRYDELLNATVESAEKRAEGYVKASGLTTGDVYDDRANAMAVLSGLTPQFLFGDAARVMAASYSAAPLYEGLITEALFVAGRADWALQRMSARAAVLNEEYIPSDYAGEGELCRAASAGYIGAFYRAIAGIEFSDGGRKVCITPDLTAIERITFDILDGTLSGRMLKNAKGTEFVIDNRTALNVTLRLKVNKGIATDEPVKLIELKKGKNVFKF